MYNEGNNSICIETKPFLGVLKLEILEYIIIIKFRKEVYGKESYVVPPDLYCKFDNHVPFNTGPGLNGTCLKKWHLEKCL